jgi:hypothetical protein
MTYRRPRVPLRVEASLAAAVTVGLSVLFWNSAFSSDVQISNFQTAASQIQLTLDGVQQTFETEIGDLAARLELQPALNQAGRATLWRLSLQEQLQVSGPGALLPGGAGRAGIQSVAFPIGQPARQQPAAGQHRNARHVALRSMRQTVLPPQPRPGDVLREVPRILYHPVRLSCYDSAVDSGHCRLLKLPRIGSLALAYQ